ncbi:MAG: sigma-70 family RNA polymerase sigma factor [Planctomycetes bacterium]|nr:sigma-70 family RNA polymerase sigma factor [Planctomycetota bacterium]
MGRFSNELPVRTIAPPNGSSSPRERWHCRCSAWYFARVNDSRIAPTVETNERALIAALKAGEPTAYEKVVRLYGGRMLSVARRFLRTEDDAQDAVQDAFLSAWKAIDSFEGTAQLSTWLHRIAVNAALMKLRVQKKHPERSIEELLPKFKADGHPFEPAAPWRDGAEVLAERKESGAFVRECIDKLPESYRTVLLLRDIDELDTEETAGVLGITPNAVKVRLHRARQALRTLLDSRLRAGGT